MSSLKVGHFFNCFLKIHPIAYNDLIIGTFNVRGHVKKKRKKSKNDWFKIEIQRLHQE